MASNKRSLAVIGSGISGLSAAWLLHKSGVHVTLYEKEAVCGGHTLTDGSGPVPVDLGFQVYNLTTYPNLVGFLECLGVDTEPSEMSFSCSMNGGEFEWGSEGFDGIFAQKQNLFSSRFLWMLYEVIRFGKNAPKVLEPENMDKFKNMTLGQYIEMENYSHLFKMCYLLPMCASVWSVPFETASQFPVIVLVRFWINHHLLDILQRPRWRVVKDRSRAYVERVLACLPDVRMGQAVTSVTSGINGKVIVSTNAGDDEYDDVILATHSDISLKILGESATAEEKKILGAIPYQSSSVYLHTDKSYMPKLKNTWSCWNFIGNDNSGAPSDAVCVTYWANKLQNFQEATPDIFITLNPESPPDASSILRKLQLEHPVFNLEGVDAQDQLDAIQGQRGIYFAGAWCGYGFHEDGINAGIKVAQALGATVPWVPRAVSPKVSLLDGFLVSIVNHFAQSAISHGALRIILPNGEELTFGEGNVDSNVDQWRGAPALKATIRLFNMKIFRKCVLRYDTGLGESYMDGDFEVDDLGALMAILARNASQMHSNQGALGLLNWIGDRLLYVKHKFRPNTVQGSRRNIEEHYDSGNDMYKLFLDESMTYSCGIHKQGSTLHEAQMAKLDSLIKKAGIQPTDHVLEIGCGWGSFAIRAVQQTGCKVTGLTVSKAQLQEAQERVKAAGLQDRINLIFCDYRDCPGAGTFDKVVSCEMIEAVGKEYLNSFFQTVSDMLKPHGTAVLQAICVPDERYNKYCSTSDFIREHIFPGGHLLCMNTMLDHASRNNMAMADFTDIGRDYALTLREWRSCWEAKKNDLIELGYSEQFWRKYRIYFAYCEAGFDCGYILTYQVTFKKNLPANDEISAVPEEVNAGTRSQSEELPFSGLDHITQGLLAVYFFLAGIAVNHRPYLWVTPATSAIFAAILAFVSSASMKLAFYKKSSRSEQILWCNNAVQLLYSSFISLLSSYQLQKASWNLIPKPGNRFDTMLVCIAMGFVGYQVWNIIRNRLYKHQPQHLLYYTIVLCLFATSAYRQEHTGMLASMLAAEWSTVFQVLKFLTLQAGMLQGHRLVQSIVTLDYISFVILRLLPHMWVLIILLSKKLSITSPVVYWMALAGIIQLNLTNFHRLVLIWKRQDNRKVHCA